jgi:metal-responsive CopG/Arc/MetJ family transcriptional regulator
VYFLSEIVRFSLRLPKTLKESFDDMTEKRGIGLNSLMILALEEYIDKFKKNEGAEKE